MLTSDLNTLLDFLQMVDGISKYKFSAKDASVDDVERMGTIECACTDTSIGMGTGTGRSIGVGKIAEIGKSVNEMAGAIGGTIAATSVLAGLCENPSLLNGSIGTVASNIIVRIFGEIVSEASEAMTEYAKYF